ncbi:MAG: DUF2088 domain-containing protein, partial [Chloroflexi bacterium]|nr:DUF2088 domain-containing protein [Chloroflexota bacterium]
MVIGKGYPDRFLSEAEAREIFAQGAAQIKPAGKKLLVIIPDSTRSGPIPLCFRALTDLLSKKVAHLDFLVALGTHIPMDEPRLCDHLGITQSERHTRYAKIGLLNHNWLEGLGRIGTIPAAQMREISGGLMDQEVPVTINERIFDYDHLLIMGPVFPHEIAGFSGGNKYFFPGIAGAEIIDATHWLGALIGCPNIIGHQDTPTRRALDVAAQFISVPRSCFSMVVKGHDDLAGLYYGSPEESQAAAAELSAQVNVVYLDRTYKTVLSVMPELYDDIWTASKGMYKLEPVVEDGGTLIIYAPHIDEISYTHGALLDRIGYHVRDYFLAQMDRFADVSRAAMAHSALVKGQGTFENGVERPRIRVVLATGIPKERCDRIGLGYMDPATINVEAWKGREDEGI